VRSQTGSPAANDLFVIIVAEDFEVADRLNRTLTRKSLRRLPQW
jgi:hypothetical protein